MCFTFVFEKVLECNFVLMSLEIVYFAFLGRGLEANELFVSEVIFEIVVKVMGFAYVFEKGESAEFCYFCVFFVLRLSCYKNWKLAS